MSNSLLSVIQIVWAANMTCSFWLMYTNFRRYQRIEKAFKESEHLGYQTRKAYDRLKKIIEEGRIKGLSDAEYRRLRDIIK